MNRRDIKYSNSSNYKEEKSSPQSKSTEMNNKHHHQRQIKLKISLFYIYNLL